MDWLSPIKELFGFVFPILEQVPVLRAILGFVLVFFLPGFAWTFVFFKQINVVERVTLSVGLSIALIVLSLMSLNVLFGMRINGLNAVLVIAAITILAVGVYYLKRLMIQRGKTSD